MLSQHSISKQNQFPNTNEPHLWYNGAALAQKSMHSFSHVMLMETTTRSFTKQVKEPWKATKGLTHLQVVSHIINHKTLLEWLVWQIIMGLTSTGFGRRVEHDALRRALDIHRTARSCKSMAIKIAIVSPSHGTWMPWFPLVHLVDNYNLQDASWSRGKSLKGWGKYIRMPVRH